MESRLLNERISLLKDWKQGEPLDEILYGALSSLHDFVNHRFNEQIQEIRGESLAINKVPVIKTAVYKGEDANKQVYLRPVSTELSAGAENYLTTVFAECDYPTIQGLLGQSFNAEIKGSSGIKRMQVALRYSSAHLRSLELLYHTYTANGLPWATVNATYFYKFLDVYSLSDYDVGEVESVEIDFDPHEKYISYDKILLWNIEPIKTIVASCEAKPAFDTLVYEHVLWGLNLDKHQYLVCPIGEEFRCFRRGSTMCVRTYKKHLDELQMLRIIEGEDLSNPLYLPLISNQKKEGLINSLANGRHLPTRGEAERLIRSCNSGIDIKLADMKVLPYTKKNFSNYKYIDYNYFVEANRFLSDRKLLLFTFESDMQKLWVYEAMFYVLSELQLYFYEYRVVGELK